MKSQVCLNLMIFVFLSFFKMSFVHALEPVKPSTSSQTKTPPAQTATPASPTTPVSPPQAGAPAAAPAAPAAPVAAPVPPAPPPAPVKADTESDKLRRKKLTFEYSLNQYFRSAHKRYPEEIQIRNEATKNFDSQNFDRAEALFKANMTKYADSPDAKSEFILFLMERNRYEQGKIQVEQARQKFPSDVKIRFIMEAMKQIEKGTSGEKRKQVKEQLKQKLDDYDVLWAEYQANNANSPPPNHH